LRKINEQLIEVFGDSTSKNLYGKAGSRHKVTREDRERRQKTREKKKTSAGWRGVCISTPRKIQKVTSTDREAPFCSKARTNTKAGYSLTNTIPASTVQDTPQARTLYREKTPPAELATTLRESERAMKWMSRPSGKIMRWWRSNLSAAWGLLLSCGVLFGGCTCHQYHLSTVRTYVVLHA
jgi:hypothetical protein